MYSIHAFTHLWYNNLILMNWLGCIILQYILNQIKPQVNVLIVYDHTGLSLYDDAKNTLCVMNTLLVVI